MSIVEGMLIPPVILMTEGMLIGGSTTIIEGMLIGPMFVPPMSTHGNTIGGGCTMFDGIGIVGIVNVGMFGRVGILISKFVSGLTAVGSAAKVLVIGV